MTRVPVLCCIFYFFYVLLWQRSMMYHNSGVIVIALSGWEGLTLSILIDCCISYRLLANKWQFALRLLSYQPIFPLMRHYRTQYCSQHLVLNKIVDVGIQCYGKHSVNLTDYCLWQQRGGMCIKSVKPWRMRHFIYPHRMEISLRFRGVLLLSLLQDAIKTTGNIYP